MWTKIKFLGLSLTLLFLLACDKEDNDESSNLFCEFLKVGNSWDYDLTFEYLDDVPHTIKVNYKIIDEENGFFKVRYMAVREKELKWYGDEEVFTDEYGTEDDQYSMPLIVKSDLPGTVRFCTHPDSYLGQVSRKKVSTSETISVPAGTFTNCIKIHEVYTGDQNLFKTYWISPKIGIIQVVEKLHFNSIYGPIEYYTVTRKLKKYTLAK